MERSLAPCTCLHYPHPVLQRRLSYLVAHQVSGQLLWSDCPVTSLTAMFSPHTTHLLFSLVRLVTWLVGAHSCWVTGGVTIKTRRGQDGSRLRWQMGTSRHRARTPSHDKTADYYDVSY